MSEKLVLVAIALVALSGMPGILVPKRSSIGERLAALLVVAGSACGLASVLGGTSSITGGLSLPWSVPGGELALRVDGVSAVFLAQIFVIAPLGSVYGLGYWPQAEHSNNGRKLRLFYGLLTAGMAMLVVAHNTVLFLVGWETMALAAFLVLTTEDTNDAVRRSGFVYLAATRIGTLCLLAMFALLRVASGGWTFAAPRQPVAPALATAVFVLALVGFGIKAGIMPMHVWLPGAHANAPSHISALMSGVLIKMGIYGLVRVCSFFEHPPFWWGAVLLGLGTASGVMGVAFAIGQHDLKRLLAYHSIENIGIITMGLGLAVLGRAVEQPVLVALGLAGALLHVWNHGLFKALLFFCAGAVHHATQTREIDHLGGLAKRMPRTALAFLVGAIAICGLPPLNGFVSELFVYLAFLRSALLAAPGIWLAGAFGAPALALVGALAVACFAKAFGAVFLGEPRSHHGRLAHEAGLAMTSPMFALGACCLLIGVLPAAVTPVLDRAAAAWSPGLSLQPPLASQAPVEWISVMSVGLIAAIVGGATLLAWLTRQRVASSGTWDCGYAAPSSRMQYTASSFAGILVGLLSWALRPEVTASRSSSPFPRGERFQSHVPDLVLDRAVLPASRAMGSLLFRFRWIQRGSVQVYLLYVLAAIVIAMVFRR
jgi:hydrogenase-4 component B